MKFRFFFVTFLFLLCSCEKIIYQQVLANREQDLKSRGGYESYLSLEYLDFSRRLSLVKDLTASEYFAQKGLDIMSGKTFIAEDPIVWEADKTMIEELILMQKKLEVLLNNKNLVYQMPIQMAHLSYLYDCWASKESKEIFVADELSHCRVSFGKLIDEIEVYVEEMSKNNVPDIQIVEPEFSRFEIIFDAENYLLNDKANKAMIEIVDYLNNFRGKFKILITANPDNAIKALYNQTLVKNRVEIVKNYLIKNGIDENSIEERIESEDFPDIIANDDIKNQINRSVGIYVLRGDSDFKPYPLPLLQNLLYKAQIEKARKERGLGN
jgi:outer membrane protein OmpA-like peptidoglycan-associated protein